MKRIAASVPEITEADFDELPMGQVRARLSTDREADVRETLFFRFADARIPILSMNYEETTLEKVFLELTAEKKPVPETDPADDAGENLSAEEIFARRAMENARNADRYADGEETAAGNTDGEKPESEEKAEAPADEPGPAGPSPAQKPNRKKNSDDDYTPLFGG